MVVACPIWQSYGEGDRQEHSFRYFLFAVESEAPVSLFHSSALLPLKDTLQKWCLQIHVFATCNPLKGFEWASQD